MSSNTAPALGSRENFMGPGADDGEDVLGDADGGAIHTEQSIQTCADKPGAQTDARQCISDAELAGWKAHKIWRDVAPKHSPIALGAPPYAPSISEAFAYSRDTDGVTVPDPETILEAHEVCALSAWLWGGDPEAIGERDRGALHHENAEVEMTDPVEYLPRRYETESWWTDYGAVRHRTRLDPEHGYATGPRLGDVARAVFLDVVDDVLGEVYESYRAITEEDLVGLQRDARRMKSAADISDEEALQRILADVFDWADERQ